MKTLKKAFEEYYIPYEKPCRNKRGFKIAYRYVGQWYVYKIDRKERYRCKCIFAVLCAFSTICFLAASLQDCELNYVTYPMLFAMLSLAALLFEWVGIVWFCLAKQKMTKYSFDEMHLILRTAPFLHTILLLCSAGTGVYMIVAKPLPPGTLAVPVLYFASGMLSFAVFRIYGRLPFEGIQNEG